jgi:hypothetical protein
VVVGDQRVVRGDFTAERGGYVGSEGGVVCVGRQVLFLSVLRSLTAGAHTLWRPVGSLDTWQRKGTSRKVINNFP